MTKKENKYQTPVAIYVRYDIENTDNWHSAEELIQDYCNKNDYKVIKVYRDTEPRCFFYSWIILDIINNRSNINYDYHKLIVFDIYDISEYESKIFAFNEFLADFEIELESVRDGIVDKDLLFGISMHKNVRGKEELKKPPTLNNNPFKNVF